MYKRMREEEGATRADFAKQREEAKGAAALALASKLFQARQGQEGQMLGAGIAEASNIYGSTLKDIRNTEKDIKKTQRELMMAEDRVKRDMSGKAKQTVDAKAAKIEDLQMRQTDQFNKAQEKASDLFSAEHINNVNAMKALEVAKMSGEYQLAVARIHERYANRPTEGQQILSTYHNILAKQGPEKAEQYMRDWGRVKEGFKPQNVYSMDDAMKAVSANPINSGLSESQLVAKARKMYEEVNKPGGGGAPSQNTAINPFKLSPEASAALKQYGGQ
jgi:hypothetical protein